MIASFVYSLLSCGAERLRVVANLGREKPLGALTSACGPGVQRSSHLHTDADLAGSLPQASSHTFTASFNVLEEEVSYISFVQSAV